MAIAVQWDNSHHSIIRWDFEPHWTWDELADSARVSSEMIASVDHDVDVILNAPDSQPPVGKMTHYHRSAFNYTPSNIRMLALVCGDAMDAVQIVSPFFHQMEVVRTLDEAREALALEIA